MANPIIALTTYKQKNVHGFPITAVMEKYISVITEAGGVPVLIPNAIGNDAIDTIVDAIDGVLFTGGGDLASTCDESNLSTPRVDVDKVRDTMEFALFSKVVEKGKPFLGICRGMQMINVAQGGSLHGHIPENLPNALKHNYHSGTERQFLAHKVEIVPGTHLDEISKTRNMYVNSLHHQGINEIAPGLIISAKAPDGMVEAIELTDYQFGIAVQWHPEWLIPQNSALNLFRAFINAARSQPDKK